MSTSDQLKTLIRAVVKEELKKALPGMMKFIIKEVSTPEPVPAKQADYNDDFFATLKNEFNGGKAAPQQPATPRIYSKNPMIQQVLSETQGGVIQDPADYGSLMDVSNLRQPAKKLPIQQAPALITEETKAQAHIGAYKDYRAFMKEVDKKKKSGPMGSIGVPGLSIEGGIPNDFSTID